MKEITVSHFRNQTIQYKEIGLKLAVAFFCWSFVGILFATQWYVQLTNAGQDITWLITLTWAVNTWGAWAILSPVIFWLANKFQITKISSWREWLFHLFAGFVFSIIQFLLQTAAGQITTWANKDSVPFTTSFHNLVSKSFHLNLLTYWAIVGISHGVGYYRKSQEREKKAAQLESRLAIAQLRALKMQLHPHFLFNTLNTISELVYIDSEAAERMISRLSDLLRITLEKKLAEEISLELELDFLNKYLEIEKIRFGERLQIEINTEEGCGAALVPTLILQPLVENSIRHGAGAIPGTVKIEIEAKKEGGKLILQVKDNGQGIPDDFAAKLNDGIGLSNTGARLSCLYEKDYRFEYFNRPANGFCVLLEIPFRSLDHQSKK